MRGNNLYWIRVGFLFGLGMLLAFLLWPILAALSTATLVLILICAIPVMIVVPLLGFVGRSVGQLRGDFILRRGWAERNRKISAAK